MRKGEKNSKPAVQNHHRFTSNSLQTQNRYKSAPQSSPDETKLATKMWRWRHAFRERHQLHNWTTGTGVATTRRQSIFLKGEITPRRCQAHWLASCGDWSLAAFAVLCAPDLTTTTRLTLSTSPARLQPTAGTSYQIIYESKPPQNYLARCGPRDQISHRRRRSALRFRLRHTKPAKPHSTGVLSRY